MEHSGLPFVPSLEFSLQAALRPARLKPELQTKPAGVGLNALSGGAIFVSFLFLKQPETKIQNLCPAA
jgi:hypothetical protein